MHLLAPFALRLLALLLIAAGALYFAGLVKGAFVLRRLTFETRADYSLPLLKSRLTPGVNLILAPADCGAPARDLARGLLGLAFANFEVVVALNNPSEADLQAWTDEFHMRVSDRPITGRCAMGEIRRVLEARTPTRLIALDLAPCAQPLAWNAALNTAQSPLIAIVGADCEFDARVVRNMIHAMVDDRPRVVAVCACAPPDGGKSLPERFASLGYLHSWLTRAAAFSAWNLAAPPAGSVLLADREALLETGFRGGPLELILDLHARLRRARASYRILFMPNAGARWRGPRTPQEIHAAEASTRREAVICAGSAALPAWLRGWVAVTHTAWPALELVAYGLTPIALVAGWVDWQVGALVLLATVGLGMLTSMAAVALCELGGSEPGGSELAGAMPSDPARLARLLIAAIVENFGFRQARNFRLLFAPGDSNG